MLQDRVTGNNVLEILKSFLSCTRPFELDILFQESREGTFFGVVEDETPVKVGKTKENLHIMHAC